MKKFKNWLRFEKDDIFQRIRNYPGYRLYLLLSAVLAFVVSFFSTWDKTFTLRVKLYDQAVLNFMVEQEPQFLKNIFQIITQFGSSYFIGFLFLLLSAILVLKKRKRAAAVCLFSLAGSYFFVVFFKQIFGRARPFGCLDNGDCLAYPSGHATMSMYFYGLMGYLIFRFLPLSWGKFLLSIFSLSTLIILVSFSRLFLGVHYLSDIFGGLFLGGAWLMLAVLTIDLLYIEIPENEK